MHTKTRHFLWALIATLTIVNVIQVEGELQLLDDYLKEMFWCGKPRCCLEYDPIIWDRYEYSHDNECETDQECDITAITLNGCGHVRNRYDSYVAGTKFVCKAMGDLGKKYCTLACKLHKARECSPPGKTYNSYYGDMEYCYFYFNNETNIIEPSCPCLRNKCDTFAGCTTNPILKNVRPPPLSPSPSPSPSPHPPFPSPSPSPHLPSPSPSPSSSPSPSPSPAPPTPSSSPSPVPSVLPEVPSPSPSPSPSPIMDCNNTCTGFVMDPPCTMDIQCRAAAEAKGCETPSKFKFKCYTPTAAVSENVCGLKCNQDTSVCGQYNSNCELPIEGGTMCCCNDHQWYADWY